ncbi:TetR/AcrR family transcriptional regulator [Listeria cornellensis]|uniref:TetR family transcriptional regulator n=1 Tax=Listeria cornellensis FSL F6-0969 TaxID=1265820 RepID=W7BI04_9LIST|nr:TetR/AcrR family transcriptional regulator [Listeria cornellensis]EUJ25537.1 TetR family transcriptional regulator [Listeria cornellensis FSL F6-0969]
MKKKEKTYQQILEVTFALFAEFGIQGTSLAMIAEKVGISKPSIYYHFSSKNALIDTVFKVIFEDYRFDNYFQVDKMTAKNFEKKLYSGGISMIPEANEENFIVMKVLNEFILTAGREHNYAGEIVGLQEDFLLGFERCIDLGVDLGVVDAKDSKAKSQVLALTIDNISNYMLMGIQVEHRKIWKLAIENIMKRVNK